MPTHTVSVGDGAFAAIKQLQERMLQQGRAFSLTRTMEYAIQFLELICDEAYKTMQIKPPEEQCKAWVNLVSRAMAIVPQRDQRRGQRPCFKASPEKRAYVMQQIITRLGIENPPKVLVDYYLDKGGMDPMIGSKVQPATEEDARKIVADADARNALRKGEPTPLTFSEKPLQDGSAPASSWPT